FPMLPQERGERGVQQDEPDERENHHQTAKKGPPVWQECSAVTAPRPIVGLDLPATVAGHKHRLTRPSSSPACPSPSVPPQLPAPSCGAVLVVEVPAWGTDEFRGRAAQGIVVPGPRQTAGWCEPSRAVGCSLRTGTGMR